MNEVLTEYGQKEIAKQSLNIFEQAKNLMVVDEAGYCLGVEIIKSLKSMQKKIEDYFEPIKSGAYKTWKEICAKEKEQLEPLEKAEDYLRDEINGYLNTLEKARKAEQEKAEREAREKAEKERQKLLEKAVQAKTEEKQESLLEKAENVYAEPVHVKPYIDKTIKTGDTTVTRKTDIKITITDPYLFIKAIAEKKAPVTVVEFRPNALKQWVKSMGIKQGDLPGILIEEISGVNIR